MKISITTVIFDMDGVLVDTVKWHFQTWHRLMTEEGLAFSYEKNEELRGLSRRDSLLLLFGDQELTEEKINLLLHRKNTYFLDAIENISPQDLAPGVELLIHELKKNHVRTAVASSSQNSKIILNRLGIEEWFHIIIDGNDVKKAKPAPDLFLMAAEHLGTPPGECVVIEDASAGVEAAHRAGMRVIGIGPVDRLKEADRCFESLVQVHAEEILSW